jgi:[ribosomal protein S5]-alanine N-acetyltransferase
MDQHLSARRRSDETLAASLGASLAPDWPPEHIDEGFWDWVESHLHPAPDSNGWLNWFVLCDDVLVGTAGFKGPPNAEGAVEVGYAIVPSFQRRGIAPQAVRVLCDHAFTDPSVTMILAETVADNHASIAVVERCGFVQTGVYEDLEVGTVLRFALPRSAQRRPL